MQSEFDALQAKQTWTLVPKTNDMSLVSSKRVFKSKTKADGSIKRYKTHLVAQGFT